MTIEIENACGAYVPIINYPVLVRRMLGVVPDACLDGIEKIELRVGVEGNRKYRRAKRRWRREKHLIQKTLGSYYPRRQNCTPYIVLYVDNLDGICADIPWFARWFLKESRFAETLFHEIGHHIHLDKRRDYRNPENTADDWADYYTIKYLRKRFWWLRPVARFTRLLPGFRTAKRRKAFERKRGIQRRFAGYENEIVAAFEERAKNAARLPTPPPAPPTESQ